jgi:uncharacterized membrane protein YqgA involved in biofilm formation
MVGLGTIINVLAILGGGLLGMLLGRFLKQPVQDALTKACGVSTLFIAIFGAVEKMRLVPDGGAMLIVICMTLGTLLGELLGIEKGFERLGDWLKRKTGNGRDNRFVEAFVTASFTVCIGAMAIVGSIQDGLLGDYSVLATKAVLDLVIIMAMTASLGKGAVFSAIPVAVLQGGVTILAGLMKDVMTTDAMTNLSLIGNILIFCVGVNLLFGKTVKVANMLPAILLAVAAAFL